MESIQQLQEPFLSRATPKTIVPKPASLLTPKIEVK